MINPKMYIRKDRGFGEVFVDTFVYMKQNFRSLFGTILLLVSPFVLLTVIVVVHIFNNAFTQAFSNINGYAANPFGIYASMLGSIALIILLSIFGYTAFIVVLNEHMLLNDELPSDQKVQIKDLLKRITKPFFKGLLNMFFLFLINLVLVFVIFLILGAFAFLIKANAFLGVLLIILGYLFFLLVVYPIQIYLFSAIMFTAQRENMFTFAALGKVIKNLRGNFWITWCTSLVGGIMTNILVSIAFIPSYVVMIISALSRVNPYMAGADPTAYEVPLYVTILFCISGILIICICAIYFIMMNLQCASNQEKKEGISIIEKIESI